MTPLAHAIREAATVHPLRACGCSNAHDQSASCASVAAAVKRNARRVSKLMNRKGVA